MSRPSRLAGVAAIARVDLLDRARAGLVGPLLLHPVVLVVLLVVASNATFFGGAPGREGYTVGVAEEGTPGPTAALVLRRLAADGAGLRPRPTADVPSAVAAGRVDAGLVVGPGDTVRVVASPASGTSKAAAARLRLALARADDGEATRPAADPIAFEHVDLRRTPTGTRLTLGRLLPLYVTLLLVPLVGETSARIRGDKTTRAAEAMHLLPVPRLDLLLGRSAVGVVDGVLRAGILLLAVGVLAAVDASWAPPLGLPAGVLAAQAVAGALQVLFCVALGCAVGAAVRTDAQEAAVTGAASVVPAVLLVALLFSDVGGMHPALAAVPLVGPAVVAREAFLGAGAASAALVAAVGTAAWCLLLLAAGRRAAERDGVTLRAA